MSSLFFLIATRKHPPRMQKRCACFATRATANAPQRGGRARFVRCSPALLQRTVAGTAAAYSPLRAARCRKGEINVTRILTISIVAAMLAFSYACKSDKPDSDSTSGGEKLEDVGHDADEAVEEAGDDVSDAVDEATE